MIKLSAYLAVLLIATPGYTAGILKKQSNCDKIPNGSRCYSEKDQVKIDEALELGQECKKTLTACRKWRDRYKALLDNDVPASTPADEHWINNRWVQIGIVGALTFGLGIGIGATF